MNVLTTVHRHHENKHYADLHFLGATDIDTSVAERSDPSNSTSPFDNALRDKLRNGDMVVIMDAATDVFVDDIRTRRDEKLQDNEDLTSPFKRYLSSSKIITASASIS
ncbi:hypothetical protein BPOR_0043g00200 [Botrytis porri]|uniref:Uncharacterized protein n=1 Tax=Botrytis porri TaxID=87229 RepID=A0A4Z1L2E2_9HELO|nr:hypothetical protein BPOR_0043g00200 [Botrytis porri]